MAETTLNDPLSGAEIVEAIVDRVREKLTRDCYLNPNSAYDWFTGHVSISLDMHDAGSQVKADHVVDISAGVRPEGVVETVFADLDLEAAPPNVVRVETGQPVPTLTKGEKGESVVKGVRYARKDAKKALANE